MKHLNPIIRVEILDVWGINFIGPFLISFENECVLVAVDYMSKWDKAIPTGTNKARVVGKFLRKKIFSRYCMLHAIICDQGTHFNHRSFDSLQKRYSIILNSSYHPHTHGWVTASNMQIKYILERIINRNRKDWVDKLIASLWAYKRLSRRL